MRECVLGYNPSDLYRPDQWEAALRAGYRCLYFPETDNGLPPVDLDAIGAGGGFLKLHGMGIRQSNLTRSVDGAPLLRSIGGAWQLNVEGVTLQGMPDAEGNPVSTDGQPLVEFHFVDGGLIRNASVSTSGGRGLYFPGVFSETTIDTLEVSRNRFEGLRMDGARNLCWQGMNRAERNGKADFRAYSGIYWKADPADRGHSTLVGQLNLEHDEREHWGMTLDGVQGLAMPGRIRLVQNGLRALTNTDRCEFGPITRYREPGTGNLPVVEIKGSFHRYDSSRVITAS